MVSTCAWNKTWSPGTLDPCVAASCQVIPFPPPDIGMQHAPDEKNQITLESEFNVYNPRLPFTMKFPGSDFCGENGDIMMIVGSIPKVNPTSQRRILTIFFLLLEKQKTIRSDLPR